MSGALTIHVREESLLVQHGGHEARVEIPVQFTEAKDIAAALRNVANGASRARQAVDVFLHSPLAQVRTLEDLPPVNGRDLRRLVANQKSRFFRTRDAQGITAAEWIRGVDQPTARVAFAPQAVLERVEEAMSECGWTVRRFVPMGAQSSRGPLLMTPDLRARGRRQRVGYILAAMGLASAGWIAAGTVYVADLYADAQAVSAELAELVEPLARIDTLEQRLADFEPIGAAFRRQSADGAWLGDQLAGLLATLPPDVHLHSLTAEREQGISVEVHALDPLLVVESLSSWWPGAVRLKSRPEPAGPEAAPSVFTVVMEGP